MGAIDYLNAHGFSARLTGDRLVVSPASRLTQDVRQYIKTHRLELIADLAALDALTPQQVGWLTAVASYLDCGISHLLSGRFIDSDDLQEQLGADPRQVAQLIKTNPRWNQ